MENRKWGDHRIMKIEEGLLILADWFDTKYPDSDNSEVQEDLRRWSKEISERNSAIEKWTNEVIKLLKDYEVANYMGGAKLLEQAEELGLIK
jgi:tRNA U54 and U55 pseudouridine synthase Pus10